MAEIASTLKTRAAALSYHRVTWFAVQGAGLESGIDDRELDRLGRVIVAPKLRGDPQRRLPSQPGPAQDSHRFGLREFPAEPGARHVEPPRQPRQRRHVGRDAR